LPSLAGRDQATIYRIIVKLDEAGVLRRLGFRDRAAHYQLIIPGHHHDYLVCKSCGTFAEVEVHQPLEPLEKEIAAQSGWKAVEHELEFFGVCPSCSD
ncbi:MAG: ferric uptake regulator, Fur family, partial [Verrucomicrobiaceae bacterium]|nr:ferric uptake regulator, Fur family [Verrucomicrobiaceae bacterium]